jgi:peroxiredoxin
MRLSLACTAMLLSSARAFAPLAPRAASSRLLATFDTPLPAAFSTPLAPGANVPDVTFKTRVRTAAPSAGANPFDWKDTSTADWFKGKRVVLFSLPGAFTPTCSSTHLPGYEGGYAAMKALGVDDVYCLSVNDAFVMRQWGLAQGLPEDEAVGSFGFKNVKLLPDGACQFTRGMGMSCVWDSERGFGERSWRYSMVVDDGKIEKVFIEGGAIVQNSDPDPFEVTDAGTMMDYLKSK